MHGIYDFENRHEFRRLTDEIVEKNGHLRESDKRVTGARLRFCTNSPRVKVVIYVENVYVDRGMSFYQANVGNAFCGEKFMGILSADNSYDSDKIYLDFENTPGETITIFLPRNPTVKNIEIGIDDDAQIFPPVDYKICLPFVFYGSSIVENGHTSVVNAYPSLLSRFFDADFYNFGFSGSARGEKEMAELIGKMPKSIFFYDYDHNAPTPEHLRNTHYNFYKIVRGYDENVPIIMTSRPANDTKDFAERENIVRETYEKAISEGDKNVYFIPGRALFGDVDENICTTDRTHPNDLGHYLIAKKLENLINEKGLLK